MSSQLKLRRGTTASHATFIGAAGETTYDTDTKSLVTHDGVTPGGTRLPTLPQLADPSGGDLVGFRNQGAGALTRTIREKALEQPSDGDYGTLQQAADAKRSGVSSFALPPGQRVLTSALNLAGYVDIRGTGEASQVKLLSGAGLRYQAATGVYDDHSHRRMRDFRVTGDGIFGGYLRPHNGTTINYANKVHSSYSSQSGMTWELGDTGYRITNGYTNIGEYTYYRANRIGLHLVNVTSHTENHMYARYNSEAALLIEGASQNVHINGGAIEGNKGRGIWVRDLDLASTPSLLLTNVYLESNGDYAGGIPSVEIQDLEKMSVKIVGGSYWRILLKNSIARRDWSRLQARWTGGFRLFSIGTGH